MSRLKSRSLVQTFEPFVRPLSPESRIQSETRFAELPIVVASTGGSAPVVGSQQGVRRIIRTMASPRKSPAVIQQQRFKATCTCQVSRRPGSSHCKPTHVMYAPPPPLAYLVYTARLCASGPRWTCLYRCSCPSHRRDWAARGTAHGNRLIVCNDMETCVNLRDDGVITEIERECEWHGPVTCPNTWQASKDPWQ